MTTSFVLGVDLDGVCGDHTEAFRRVVAAERGIDPLTLGEQTGWDFHDWGVDDDEFLELHRRGVLEHRMFRTMPVVPGVAAALWRLSDAGVWIRLITHRLYASWGHAVAVTDTVAWLDDAGIPYRDLCFLGDKPDVGADLYIDDAPHNLEALRSAGHATLVFDQPYNRTVSGPRAHSWDEVESLVLEAMVRRGIPVQAHLLEVGDAGDRLTTALRRRGVPPVDSTPTRDER